MVISHVQDREFVAQVGELLETSNTEDLICHLRCYWPNDRLLELLDCGRDDAVKMALLCLALMGTMKETPDIARLLHDDDPRLAELAEHTLWAIWFRAGDVDDNVLLAEAVELLGKDHINTAIELLTGIIRRNPTFAEAHNQRAIANLLKGDYLQALEDCQNALRYNEYHFYAMAGLGHTHVSLGQYKQALEAYRDSLELHPRLAGIRQSIREVKQYVS